MAYSSSVSPCAQITTAKLRTKALVLSLHRQSSSLPATLQRRLRQQRVISLPVTALITTPKVVTLSRVGKRMSKWHEIELQVREYELDQHGVVNNAVYSSYCQLGMHELVERAGIGLDAISQSGHAWALSQLSLKFLAPLKIRDRFVLKLRIVEVSAARVYFEHFIFKLQDQQPIFEANATAVMLDKNYRPVRIPSEIKRKLIQFILDGETGQ